MPTIASIDDGRGREAENPLHLPRAAWRDILIRTWNETGSDNVGLISAGVAFYTFLALVPLIAAFVLTYGLLADASTVADHLKVLFDLLPADAASLIGEQMVAVTKTAADKTGMGLAVALLLAIYGAMNGASAIITALNIAYDEAETRSFIRTTLLSLAITLGLLLVGILTALAISALALLEGLMPWAPPVLMTSIRIVFWAAAALGASAVIASIYRYAPNRRHARWRWLTAGSLFGTIGWLAMTLGFGLYVANIANYNATYGALSAVVVLLMWLFLSAYILIVGAELNSEIEHQTAHDTTVGAPKPMGERHAYVADTLGDVP